MPERMTSQPQRVKDGDVVVFDVLEWNAGWDFDRAAMLLRPVLIFGAGRSGDDLIEDACERLGLPEVGLRSEDTAESLARDGMNLRTLKRRFAESLAGKEFPQREYEARRVAVKFTWRDDPDPDGDGGWFDTIEVEMEDGR